MASDNSDLKAQTAEAAPCQILTCVTMGVKMLPKFKAHRANSGSSLPLTASTGEEMSYQLS